MMLQVEVCLGVLKTMRARCCLWLVLLCQICCRVGHSWKFTLPGVSKRVVSRTSLRTVTSSIAPPVVEQVSGRVQVAGMRFIVPGDYVVHEKYGIGKYTGMHQVNIAPLDAKVCNVPAVTVKYLDGEVTWFQRFAEKELWMYRTADSEGVSMQLSSLLDNRKWVKRKKVVEEKSKSMAIDLLKMLAVRNSIHRKPYTPDGAQFASLVARFPYKETPDQTLCFQHVREDMVGRSRPMDRLVCGDVGFGKTEVAVRAVYRTVCSGRQAALLVPTRVLARQHERTLRERMPGVNIQLLKGGTKGKDASKVKADIRSGACQVVIGTHAVLQPTVEFRDLGLLVVDEEQRFGVAHKEWMKSRATGVDVLTLSATPIPRTLQLSLSGLRDISVIQSPPEGRTPVEVHVRAETLLLETSDTAPDTADTASTDDVIRTALIRELSRGGQVFLVVPYIRDVQPTCERLRGLLPAGARILEAHGQHADLENRVEQFLNKEAEVLVATTIIESGVDMPNVNTMIVLSAERFGISTLYQLKGRVGRSTKQAYAYFITSPGALTVQAEQRLNFLQTFTALGSGYELARRDMELRGHGNIFGAEQSGAQDIGLDLEAKILADAIELYKQKNWNDEIRE